VKEDNFFMKKAIAEARKSRLFPKVGALVVKNEKIFCRSHRENFGIKSVHAEEMILLFNRNLSDTSLYMTLEPCIYRNDGEKSCTDLIIDSGIKKVIIGFKDLNLKNSGKGITKLKEAGVSVSIVSNGMEKELLELLGAGYIQKHG